MRSAGHLGHELDGEWIVNIPRDKSVTIITSICSLLHDLHLRHAVSLVASSSSSRNLEYCSN